MCMEKWTSYLHETPVDVLISENMKKALSLANKERQSRKDIVYLLIDVVITLAQLNLPFRGHNEGEVSTNKVVFKGIVEFISRYHPPLMIHLQKGQEIQKLRKDQLSIVVRYVNINGEIIESLLDLIDVANCTAVGKCYASQGEGKKIGTLKSLSDTRWSSRAEACQVLLENISVLLKVLDSIIYDGKYDSGIASDAFSLSKCIDFQFCLCLVTFTDILKLCNIISKYLQNEVLNISSASLHIESLISTLQGYTTEAYFDQLLYLQAEKIAENIGVTYSEPRHRKVPTRLDDSEHHVPIVLTGKDRMKAQFFNDVIELIKEALQSRFSHETMPLLKSNECLNPPKAENIQI
ncbi:Zinc finger MYM-type protein 1-like [Oopsacas minuta]|uniref:Zinc finger MYM-type protein 1-like n=1 Tax=Oopsacas minuta TaxID=111878 RepID=A0AAV7K769_9METZ|nr:Zinc finger MYM-type protein 1-like [Oopsacas minuta]